MYEGTNYTLSNSQGTLGQAYLGTSSAGNPNTATSPTWTLNADNGLTFGSPYGNQIVTLPSITFSASSPLVTFSFTFQTWIKVTLDSYVGQDTLLTIFGIVDSSTKSDVLLLQYLNTASTLPHLSLSLPSTGQTNNLGGYKIPTGLQLEFEVWLSLSFSMAAHGTTLYYQSALKDYIYGYGSYTSTFTLPSSYYCTIGGGDRSMRGQVGSFQIFSPGTLIYLDPSSSCYNSHTCYLDVGFTQAMTCLTYPSSSCDSSCSYCSTTSVDGCVSCKSSSNVVENGYCNCPLGNYISSGSSCSACTITNCSACLSPSTCQSCVTGEYPVNNVCTSCTSPCQNCANTANSCTSCISGYGLTSTASCTECGSGKYQNSSSLCDACTSPCGNCTGTATTCTSCVSGYDFLSSSNTCVCGAGTYQSDSGCAPCTLPCGNCTTASTCTSCVSNYTLAEGGCYCYNNQYNLGSGLGCANCTSPCGMCTDTPTTCTYCVSSYTLIRSTNSCVCAAGKYDTGSSCATCTSPCGNCTGTATTCTSCASGYTFLSSSNTCVCGAGTYQSGSSCIACTSPCGNCTGTATTCTSCASGYTLIATNTCGCAAGTLDTGSGCATCASPCSGCTGDIYTCSSCSSNYTYSTNSCGCDAGTYDNADGCEACTAPCYNCLGGSTMCTSCASGYIKVGNTCQCPAGTYDTGSTCASCQSPCDNCTGTITNCTSCISGYQLLTDNTCIIRSLCPSGQYYYSDGSCKTFCNAPYTPSQDNTTGILYCDVCTQSNTAISTSDGDSTTLYYYPSDGICRYICDTPYYVKTQGTLIYCQLPLSQAEVAQVQSTSASSNTAAQAVTGSIVAVSAFMPTDPNGISSGSLAKLFEYTRYFPVTRSAKLEQFFADKRATPGAVSIGRDLPDNVKTEVPYHPVAPIMAINNLHSSFFVNFFTDMESLLIISGGVLVVLVGEILVKKHLNPFLVHYIKLRIAVIAFLVTQFYNVYTEIMFYCVIEFQTYKSTDGYDWLGLITAVLFLGLGILVLFWHARMLKRYQTTKAQVVPEELAKQNLEQFQKKHENFQNLYKDFRDASFLCQSYLWLITIRTLVSTLLLSTLYDHPIPQTILITTLTVGMIIYLIWKYPHKDIFAVLQQVAFELDFLILNTCFIIMAFLDYNESTNQDLRDTLGDIVIKAIFASKFLSMISLVPKVIKVIMDIIKQKIKERKERMEAIAKKKEKAKAKAEAKAKAKAKAKKLEIAEERRPETPLLITPLSGTGRSLEELKSPETRDNADGSPSSKPLVRNSLARSPINLEEMKSPERPETHESRDPTPSIKSVNRLIQTPLARSSLSLEELKSPETHENADESPISNMAEELDELKIINLSQNEIEPEPEMYIKEDEKEEEDEEEKEDQAMSLVIKLDGREEMIQQSKSNNEIGIPRSPKPRFIRAYTSKLTKVNIDNSVSPIGKRPPWNPDTKIDPL